MNVVSIIFEYLFVATAHGEMKWFQHKLPEVSPAVYVAIVLFSMSTWMDVVGVWIEMPLFVTTLPEGWSLPSYLAIIIQLSNVGPAAYAIIQKIHQGTKKTKSTKNSKTTKRLDVEVVLTLAIIITEAVNVFLLSFSWQITSIIAGHSRSVAMLMQMVPTSLTSCMTSLVFLPYMARFPSSYISAYYVGQGFSGLIPGLIGLIQGAGSPPNCIRNSTLVVNDTVGNITNETTFYGLVNATTNVIIESQKPLFSVQMFFFCLTVLFLVSLAAFCCLNFTKCGQSAMIVTNGTSDERFRSADKPALDETPVTNFDSPEHSVHQLCQVVHEHSETVESTAAQNEQSKCRNCQELLMKMENGVDASESCQQSSSAIETSQEMKNGVFVWLLVIVGIVNALLNGILPATESYTCLPYGYLVYTLAVRLSSVAQSLASLSTMFLPRASVKAVSILTLVGVTFAAFHVILALQSPNPVLRGHLAGDIIVVSKSASLRFLDCLEQQYVCFLSVCVLRTLLLFTGLFYWISPG